MMKAVQYINSGTWTHIGKDLPRIEGNGMKISPAQPWGIQLPLDLIHPKWVGASISTPRHLHKTIDEKIASEVLSLC